MVNKEQEDVKAVPAGHGRRRVQMDFPEAAMKEVDKLQKVLGVGSRGEVIRFALGLLKLVAEKKGGRVLLDDGTVQREVVLPILGTQDVAGES